MEGGVKYQVIIAQQDRADSNNITTWTEYYICNKKRDVHEHILLKRIPPVWHETLEPEWDIIGPQLSRLHEMSDIDVEIFFNKCYGEYQKAGADYYDKYDITVQEYTEPRFKRIKRADSTIQ